MDASSTWRSGIAIVRQQYLVPFSAGLGSAFCVIRLKAAKLGEKLPAKHFHTKAFFAKLLYLQRVKFKSMEKLK